MLGSAWVALLRMRQMGAYNNLRFPRYALRRNHDDIVGAMSHDLDYFKRMFVQAGFIRSSNASGIMGLLYRGIRLREGGAAPRVTPDPNLRVYASGNAAAEVSQVC